MQFETQGKAAKQLVSKTRHIAVRSLLRHRYIAAASLMQLSLIDVTFAFRQVSECERTELLQELAAFKHAQRDLVDEVQRLEPEAWVTCITYITYVAYDAYVTCVTCVAG